MTAPLRNFDQPIQLVVVGVDLNLKFYLNFFNVAFFVRSRGQRRLADG